MDRYLQSSHSRLTRMSEFFGFQMWNLNVGTFVISTQGHYEVGFEIQPWNLLVLTSLETPTH